jgi:hypothetical protein
VILAEVLRGFAVVLYECETWFPAVREADLWAFS